MKAVLQRVAHCTVHVKEQCISSIGKGLLIFLGIEREDTLEKAKREEANLQLSIIQQIRNYIQ